MDSVGAILGLMGVREWFFLGLALITFGGFRQRNAERDAFYRRNASGVEEFKSYDEMKKVQRRSGFSRLLMVIGVFIAVPAGMGWLLKTLLTR
ncbi:hypothetical protein M3I54_41900 [Paraburkholderia sp. CNPSo 3274]|uniref:hypothetical protein n=1 Tax=Paraburkholderia sp. CNPSo 3274 TaxID=2940932 RepID=UPI0020B68F31|nr:hypothetical protein [Paraburkholderia sp. CNPSo 3274]MCP3713339.1 hypothetical protein [Paraburkholderia sp. CNPSo 3274]